MAVRTFSTSTLGANQSKSDKVAGVGQAIIGNTPTGTYSADGYTYTYWQFNANDTLNVLRAGYAEVLIIGGGGGGSLSAQNGTRRAGAGGGQIVRASWLPQGSHAVTIGAGGADNPDQSNGGAGSNGEATSIANVDTATGGMYGYARIRAYTDYAGWSGSGGANVQGGGNSASAFTATNVGGGAGGTDLGSNIYDGRTFDYTGTPTEYSQGGISTEASAANTGKGGSGSNVGNGGSGVVIIRTRNDGTLG